MSYTLVSGNAKTGISSCVSSSTRSRGNIAGIFGKAVLSRQCLLTVSNQSQTDPVKSVSELNAKINYV